MKKITPDTELTSLKIPYFKVTLEEVFLYSSEALANMETNAHLTPRQLAAQSCLPLEKVIQKLYRVIENCRDIAIRHETLLNLLNPAEVENSKSDFLLLYLDHKFGFDYGVTTIDMENRFSEALFLRLKGPKHVVIISNNSSRSFSAAMYLRGNDLKQIQFLDGQPVS